MTAPELAEIVAGVYAYVQPDGSWMINNTGLITGSDGQYVLVDTTSTERRNRELLAAVERVSAAAPRALVNTHHHGDHTYGNWLMPPGTPIVGHVLCREDVLNAGLIASQLLPGPDYGRIELRPPDTTFTDSMTMHLADRTVELLHVGPAHTRSDVLVWLPAERTVFTGDVGFAGGQPFLIEGSVLGYPRALEAVRALGPEVLVPGHGPVRRGEEVSRLLDDLTSYAAFVTELAGEGLRAGHPPLEAVRAAGDHPFAAWQESERLVANLHRAYAELDPERSFDITVAWTDMLTVHGGPIHCRA
ncbi:MAG TPA: MBL fold metallo-hydrolase [Pseudonocardiaceae bacterium]